MLGLPTLASESFRSWVFDVERFQPLNSAARSNTLGI
jgi:hypothetical protein